jgi:hypothetical protein
MASAPHLQPDSSPHHENDRSRTAREIHQDRVALLVMALIFAVALALLIWAATQGGAPQGMPLGVP